MKPVAFQYERPESAEEAAAVLAEHGDEAKVLAGGQSLVPALNMRIARPSVLVDVNRLPLAEVAAEDGSLRVGALVRQADPRLLAHPLLAEAIPFVGHFVTRNRGTVAGSLAHADASAELPLCLALLGGSVVTSAGREIAADELFVTHWTTSLEPTELVVATVWPTPEPGAGTRSASWRSGTATSRCARPRRRRAGRSCASRSAPWSTGRRCSRSTRTPRASRPQRRSSRSGTSTPRPTT